VMSFGLVPALRELCSGIDDSGLIRCRLLAYGVEERMETQKEIGVYRMVQELISNILKHARASDIIIQLNHSEGSVSVTVEDNGIGFDVAARKLSSGMGLKNLEARAEKIGGIYHVDSSPGKGTVSIIEIPI
jgi:two-component system, NarL family, sensor kinase